MNQESAEAPPASSPIGQAILPPDIIHGASGYFDGLCSFCGTKGRFEGELRLARAEFPCPSCKATLRYRDQAAAILSHCADGTELFLEAFVRTERSKSLRILEAAIGGPFIRRFKALPHYRQCYLFDDVPIGEMRDGILCQNLKALSYASNSFDLVVTSDVMEHVDDVEAVIAEIARVLRPGGAHVFSIPMYVPIREKSISRARIVDGSIEHLVEPRYHRSGTGTPSLVFTDFGADLLAMHRRAGLRARFQSSHQLIERLRHFPTVVAIKDQVRLPA
jgi:SAM-dependent methyltransferase